MTRSFNHHFRLKTDYLAAFAVTLAPILYFLPALRNHAVLCPDDGFLFNVPVRVAAAQMILAGHLPLWDPYIFSGMPLLASAQGGLLFPPNWFYLVFSPAVATNLMVVSTYMIAALGAYLYARRTGASVVGATITSLIWQWGGFLIGQISHINIVHTATLLPWVLWALEEYVRTGKRGRAVLLAVLVAVQAFAGHQQTFAYSLMLVAAYAILMAVTNAQNRKRYLGSLAFIVAGVLIAAVQIVPTFELLRNSTRAAATYEFFTSFSMPRRFALTLFAPYVMGGGDARLFKALYTGPPFFTEFLVYAGILGIMLAAVAVLLKPDILTKFWIGVAIVAFLLALGGHAPLRLYSLIYHIPVLNLFRVPSRHLMELQFALAVLAGRGLTALATRRESQPEHSRKMWRVAIAIGLTFTLACLAVTWLRPANFHPGRVAAISVMRAPELFMPIVLAAASGWALWAFARRRRRATALLLAVLAFDLIIAGQSSGWYTGSPRTDGEYWRLPEVVKTLREIAPSDTSSYRILTAPHTFDPGVPPVPPSVSHSTDWVLWTQADVYMVHGIQNAAGYDGFGLERYSQLAGRMKVWGELTDPDTTLRGNSREIDLLNVRYLFSMRPQASAPSSASTLNDFPPATENYGGFGFAQNNFGIPYLNQAKRLTFAIPPVEVNQVALLTNLAWSENVPNKTVIGRVRLKAKDGRVFEFALKAGVDSAEWSYDRPEIRDRIQHQRPAVATSYEVTDAQGNYQAHTYFSAFALPGKISITSGEILLESKPQWPNLQLSVGRVSLVNTEEGKSYPLRREWVSIEPLASPTQVAEVPKPNSARWKLVSQTQYVDIFENARALPRAWLVSEVRTMDERSVLEVIRTGKLPDESQWNPLKTALVDSQPAGSIQGCTTCEAQVTQYEPNRISVKTRSDTASVLVLSENHYPGWRARVDGQAAEVMRVNYNQRGILLPPGGHLVTFVYQPKSVLIGFIISLLTFIVLLGWSRMHSWTRSPDSASQL